MLIASCLTCEIDAQSKMCVLSMDKEMWDFWCFWMNGLLSIEHHSRTRLGYADRGFKRPAELEKVGWSTTLPPLNLPFWFRSKWITPDRYDLFRSEVTELFLVRNSHYGTVRVEFKYVTETFDDVDQKWKLI